MAQRELALHRQLWLRNHRTSAQCVMPHCSTKHEGPGGNGHPPVGTIYPHMGPHAWVTVDALCSARLCSWSHGTLKLCHFIAREKLPPVSPRSGSKQCWEVLISSPIPSISFPAQRRAKLFKTATLPLFPGFSVNKGQPKARATKLEDPRVTFPQWQLSCPGSRGWHSVLVSP